MKPKNQKQNNRIVMMNGQKMICKNGKCKPMAGMGMKKKSKKNWIKGAIKNPGALHRELGIKPGAKIPVETLKRLANGKDKQKARQAKLALTLRNLKS